MELYRSEQGGVRPVLIIQNNRGNQYSPTVIAAAITGRKKRWMLSVYFRDDNENHARAKNAEYRKAKISNETFEVLMYYLAEYRELLQHQEKLFVNISGDTAGQPLTADGVYSMRNRLQEKTGIFITPHMLRRYFANMRRKAGWRLELIQQALGHKHIDTTIKYLNIVDDELLEASQQFYEKHSALYGIQELLQGGD